jgi:hypothetical protein
MSKDWWITAAQWALWGMVMSLAMGWLAKNRLKRHPNTSPRHLYHPISTLIVGLVCFVFFAGIATISNVYANKTTTWWTTTIFIGFAAMSVPVVADYFLARHELSDAGLSYGRLSGTRGYLKWSELYRVQYAPVMKWFRLETSSGKVARISAMLVGLPEFAQHLLRHAPPEAIEKNTLHILQATAHGNPPPVW